MTYHAECLRNRMVRCLATCVVTGVLMFCASVNAQPTPIPKSAAFDSAIREQQPNYLLPRHVSAPDGELTLFADFKHPEAGSIPIYVVNRTRRAVSFASQDGNIYLKLEARMPDGSWQRAQSHQASRCGNSYGMATLPVGQYWRLAGYQPAEGRPAKVRFAIRGEQENATNSGDGLVSDIDLADANKDGMSRARIPFDTALMALDEETSNAARQSTWADRVAALRLVARWEENGYYRDKAEKLVQVARADGSPDALAAATAINGVLSAGWPRSADPAAFVSVCFADLQLPANRKAEFGAVGANPLLVWRVLHELAQAHFVYDRPQSGPTTVKMADWRPVVELARRRVDGMPDYAVTTLLAIPALADEFVEDRFFEERVSSGDQLVRQMAIETLGRRGRFETLVALGGQLAPAVQIEVLAALAEGGPKGGDADGSPARFPAEGAETAFWAACMNQQPVAAMAALEKADAFGRGNSVFPNEVEAAAMAFLRAEAHQVAAVSDDFKLPPTTDFNLALRFLASRRDWRYEPEVLEKPLAHRGYNEMESWTAGSNERWEIHRFPVREFALEELKKMNRAPRQTIQVEKRFPLPPAAPMPVDPTKPL